MAKIFVTGATGYVGSRLTEKLIQQGHSVTCLCRTKDKEKSLRDFGAKICLGNILDKQLLKNMIKMGDFDIIYHLAAIVYPALNSRYYATNILGTKYLLDACVKKAVKRFIFLSSAAVYGLNIKDKIILPETYPCNPKDPYGKSKFLAEKTIREYSTKFNIPYTIIRAPVIYGPGMQEYSPNKLFINPIKKNIFCFIGKGDTILTLCYIDDIVEGLILAMNNKAAYEVFNIADDYYPIKEIIYIIADLLHKRHPRLHMPKYIGYVLLLIINCYLFFKGTRPLIGFEIIGYLTSNWCLDITKAKSVLDYNPSVELKKGLYNMIYDT